MGIPVRSRLLDYVEGESSADTARASSPAPEPRRSRLFEYAAQVDHVENPVSAGSETEAERPASAAPKPGVPAYHTPVFVPAHPRYVDVADAGGRPVRVPFIAYELFEHPTAGPGTRTGAGTRTETESESESESESGIVAFAFTTCDRLVAALGEAQPWIATSIGPLAEAVDAYDVTVLLDPRVVPGQHNWHPDDLAAYTREVR